MSQLDLFIHYRRPADVVLFPFVRRAALARSIAAELDRLDFANGKKLWNCRCAEIRKQLRREGWSTTAIRAEIDGLADAVHEELRILLFPKQIKRSAMVVSLTMKRRNTFPHGDGAGVAGAGGQGTKFLARVWGEQPHEPSEYDAAHAREGGDAA